VASPKLARTEHSSFADFKGNNTNLMQTKRAMKALQQP